jgi:hypothetical protein
MTAFYQSPTRLAKGCAILDQSSSQDNHLPLTILEGHVRATAVALAGEHGPETIRAIVGLRP